MLKHAITKLNWTPISLETYPQWSLGQGPIFALWPSPVGHDACFKEIGFQDFADLEEPWDEDFSRFTQELKKEIEKLGPASLYASDGFVKPKFLRDYLKNIFIKSSDPELSLEEKIAIPALDDQFKDTLIDFGEPIQVRLRVGGGHPIFWLNFIPSAQAYFQTMLRSFAQNYEVRELPLEKITLLMGF